MSDPCNLLVQIKDSLMRGSDSNLVTGIFEEEEPTSSHRSWGQSWCQSHSLCPQGEQIPDKEFPRDSSQCGSYCPSAGKKHHDQDTL